MKNKKKVADLETADTTICKKTMLTSKEAAKFLGVSLSCLYSWTADRIVPHYKPAGKLCYFDREELKPWLESSRVTTKRELETQEQNINNK